MKHSVCYVVQSMYEFDPRVRRKAEALAKAGYDVDVLCLRSPDGRQTYSLNGVNVRTMALGKARGSLARYFYEYGAFFLWAAWRVPLQMSRERYCVIDVNSLPDFLIFAPILAGWMGAKLLLDLHEITPEFYMSKYRVARESRVIRLLTFLEDISMKFADHVITISDPVLDLLASRGLDRSKATVMMNAVDEARFAAMASGPQGSQDGNKFVMVYHGTLTEIYGLDIAVEAFAQARAQMPGAELWILGSGTQKDELAGLVEKHKLAEQVKLIGQVPPTEIPKWLSQCDAGILPIRQDVFLDFAFPNKLPEFIVMGKPVIMSRLKAIRHYFGEDALGYFEPNNPADLAREMIRMYGDRERRRALVARAREQYVPIRWEIMEQRYLKLIGALEKGRTVNVETGRAIA